MEHPYQVKKVSDEGSSSPFVARIFMSMLGFRDLFLCSNLDGRELSEARDKFDKKFTPMYEAAQATRDGGRELITLIKKHRMSLASGNAVRIQNNQYDILETIDTPLGQATDKIITQGIIAIKTGLQKCLSEVFSIDIGFIFQKPTPFNHGIASLRKTGESDFADYLKQVREKWLSDLLALRNQQEHDGWTLKGTQYSLVSGTTVIVSFPNLLGLPIEQFAQRTSNRILLFIENSMVYAFQKTSRGLPINIIEIPQHSRDSSYPQRFRLAPRGLDPSQPWKITYSDNIEFI